MLNLGFAVRSVILDIDGSVFDSKKIYRKILKRALNSGPDSFLNQFYFSTLEENRSKSILGLRERLDNLIYVFFEQIDVRKPKMFKGVREFLEKLNESNIKIFASTGSTIGKAAKMMKKADISQFFELILGREIPKVKHISFFAKYLNMSVREFSRQAIYIGDEPIDMILAKRFGIYGIGITNTFSSQLLEKFGAEKIVNNFKELIEL